jgi:hypothetical protein
MFALFLFCVWFIVVLLPALEKKAKSLPGGVSILPGFPVMPLLAWGIAALLDLAHPQLGYYVVGGLHVILLAVSGVFALKYLYEIKRKA